MPSLADLAHHVSLPCSMIIATSSPERGPNVVRCAGARMGTDGRLIVGVAMPEGASSLLDIDGNGLVALTATLPSSYKTLQAKGRDAKRVEWPEGALVAAAHHAAFVEHLAALQISRELGGRFWSLQFEAIAFTPDEIFDQTPGKRHR